MVFYRHTNDQTTPCTLKLNRVEIEIKITPLEIQHVHGQMSIHNTVNAAIDIQFNGCFGRNNNLLTISLFQIRPHFTATHTFESFDFNKKRAHKLHNHTSTSIVNVFYSHSNTIISFQSNICIPNTQTHTHKMP